MLGEVNIYQESRLALNKPTSALTRTNRESRLLRDVVGAPSDKLLRTTSSEEQSRRHQKACSSQSSRSCKRRNPSLKIRLAGIDFG